MGSSPSSERYPSLEIVYEELASLLQRQNAHVDALDSKSSIVIGFTALVLGVAATQSRSSVTLAMQAAVALGAASLAFALLAFRSRPFVSLPEPRRFYQEFAANVPEQTRLVLCNLATTALERNEPHVRAKARWLKLSLKFLSGTMAAVVIAFYSGGA